MKKIISITIIAFILLLFTALSALAGNPPGMIVRDDGQSEEAPWGQTDSYIPQDNTELTPTSSASIETKPIENDSAAIKIVIIYKSLFVLKIEFNPVIYEEVIR